MNMTANELLTMIFDTLTEHLAGIESWLPLATMIGLTIFGIVLLTRGARMAPGLMGIGVMVLGGLGGLAMSNAFAWPELPIIAAGGVLGLVVGLVLCRLWLALLLGTCVAGASLSVYYAQHLSPYVEAHLSENHGAEDGWVGLPPAEAHAETPMQALGNLWEYLQANVPNFTLQFWAITLVSGLVGLVFGWFVPRGARAATAATAGTIALFVGLVGTLKVAAPQVLAQLQELGPWSWSIVAGVWTAALIWNAWAVRRKKRPAAEDAEEEAPPRRKAATA